MPIVLDLPKCQTWQTRNRSKFAMLWPPSCKINMASKSEPEVKTLNLNMETFVLATGSSNTSAVDEISR